MRALASLVQTWWSSTNDPGKFRFASAGLGMGVMDSHNPALAGQVAAWWPLANASNLN